MMKKTWIDTFPVPTVSHFNDGYITFITESSLEVGMSKPFLHVKNKKDSVSE